MNVLKRLPIWILLISTLFTFACVYIVLPEGVAAPGSGDGNGSGVWSAIVTGVGQSDAGDLHIDITIRNDSGDWSTMRAVAKKPAVLTSGDGKTVNCDTVFVNTGGHRFAPGFQMRGYTVNEAGELKTQTLYVECKGVTDAAGTSGGITVMTYGDIAGELT